MQVLLQSRHAGPDNEDATGTKVPKVSEVLDTIGTLVKCSNVSVCVDRMLELQFWNVEKVQRKYSERK